MKKHLDKVIGLLGLALGIGALAANALMTAGGALVTAMAMAGTGLLVWFFAAHSESFRAFSKKRSTHQRLNSILMVGFFIFIVVLLNLIIRQYYFRFDFSASKQYSLSERGSELASSLSLPVHLMFFGSEEKDEYTRMRGLFEAYRYLNKMITFDLHDLDSVPVLAKEFNVTAENTIVVQTDAAWYSERGTDEQTLTNLLTRATRRSKAHIRFLAGHGEHRIEGGKRTDYDLIAGRLRSVGYLVSSLNLLAVDEIPDDTAVVVLAGPITDPSGAEVEKLWSYRLRGGSLLILVNAPGQAKGLINALRLRLGEYPVYDSENAAVSNPSIPVVSTYHDTPVTRDFKLSTMFPGVYPIIFKPEYMGSYRFDPMAGTGQNSWLDSNGNGKKDPGEESGAFVIAGILTDSKNPFRTVLIGDSDFVSNAYAGVPGNTELFMRSIGWLSQENVNVSGAPGGMLVTMFVTGRQARLVRNLASIGIPLLIAIAGSIIWMRRRRL